MKVELDLSNYATKAILKKCNRCWYIESCLKNYLANLKSDTYKLDIGKLKNVPSNSSNLKSKVEKLDADKLVPVPVDLSKPKDVVKNDVVKKDAFNLNLKNIKDKIPDITNWATNTNLNTKTNTYKIPSINNLAKTTARNAKINEVKKNPLILPTQLLLLLLPILKIKYLTIVNISLLQNLIS